MGHQGHFQTATKGRAVNGGDHWLGRVFHGVLHVLQGGALHSPTKFGDIGTSDEGTAFADQHDGLGRRISNRSLEALEQAFADIGRQGVHGRGIEGDDGHIPVEG